MTFAFVAIHHPRPERRQELLDGMLEMGTVMAAAPGYLGAGPWEDAHTDRILGISFWESEAAFRAAVPPGIGDPSDEVPEAETRPRDVFLLQSYERPDADGFAAFFEAMSDDEGGSGADGFAEQFLSLDPSTVAVVGREQLRAALPARHAMFGSIGATGTRLSGLDVTRLDDRHVLARTTWDVLFADESAEPMRLESTYLLRRDGGRWQAVVYLNHRDVAAEVAARAGRG
ncbi:MULTISPECIES: antibiotic biosynthesis monooxygenase family protein [unclassified Isoptericola]|uniref:antibiotic biosynthesis monooxygenase family protein n=1 Tax=unclassified Isoptericola TaxID=2623355 RepID=UPI0036573EFD